jgi:hypothetical protein
MNAIEVFQEADGRWRWEYRDGTVTLKSNRTYGDAGVALHAAQMAYPDSFEDGSRSLARSEGVVKKLANLLAVALVIVVWRRRRSTAL